jgi:hypothetical protein
MRRPSRPRPHPPLACLSDSVSKSGNPAAGCFRRMYSIGVERQLSELKLSYLHAMAVGGRMCGIIPM